MSAMKFMKFLLIKNVDSLSKKYGELTGIVKDDKKNGKHNNTSTGELSVRTLAMVYIMKDFMQVQHENAEWIMKYDV